MRPACLPCPLPQDAAGFPPDMAEAAATEPWLRQLMKVQACSVQLTRAQVRQELDGFRRALCLDLLGAPSAEETHGAAQPVLKETANPTLTMPLGAPEISRDRPWTRHAGDSSCFRIVEDVRGLLDEHREQYRQLVERHDRAVRELLVGSSRPASTSPTPGDVVATCRLDFEPAAEPASSSTGSLPFPEPPPLDEEVYWASQKNALNSRQGSCDTKELDLLGMEANLFRDMDVKDEQKASDGDDDDDEFRVKGAFGGMGGRKKRRKTLKEDEYTVATYYKQHGLAQKVARSREFEQTALAVITLNAIYMGIDADNNHADSFLHSKWYFIMCECLFCAFFTWEWCVRFLSFERKIDCLRDFWFKFDSCLVCFMLLETVLMPSILLLTGVDIDVIPTFPLRLLRLLRLSRLSRLMRSLPELVTMLRGMWVASRAVGSSLLMVVMLIYLFGIIIYMLLKEETEVEFWFKTLPRCMWTLFIDGTILDSPGEVLHALLDLDSAMAYVSVFIFLFFVLLSALTVMNMLVGVLCEVVSQVTQAEKDEAAIKLVKKAFLSELKSFDKDGSGTISRDELERAMLNPQALRTLSHLDVDIGCMKELQTMLFPKPDSQAMIESVMELLLSYRGSLPCTVRHVVDGQAYTRWYLSQHTKHLSDALDSLRTDMQKLVRLAPEKL